MKGFGKFLVGGLLGAAFGFFLAPKHAQRVRDVLTGAGGATGAAVFDRPEAPSLHVPVAPVTAPLPVVEPEPEPVVEPESIIEMEAVADTEEPPAPVSFATPADLPVEADAWASEDEPTLEEEQPPVGTMEEDASAPLDLKTRIEETRRRIQEELERPFTAAVPVGLDSTVEESSQGGAPPADDSGAQEEPVAPAWVAPVWPAPPSAEVVEVELPVDLTVGSSVEAAEESPLERADESVVEPAIEMPALITETSSAEESSESASPGDAAGDFDREAMRLRIEATRNRLKAKAFDAMMSGESALLARDGGGGPETGSRSPDLQVDSEVDETIEKTLSEEDV